MKYRLLGSSSLRVSEVCLGAMTFGEETGIGASEEVSKAVYDEYLEQGGNFIDTANIYTLGSSERMLAKFIGANRDDLVVASKYSMTTDAARLNAGGNHRKNLTQALEMSLQRLNTDFIDLYWVHGWDQVTPVGEVMRALDDMVRAGKILHIGISNAPAWYIAEANTLARERNMTPFTAMQLHYSLVERGIEADYFDLAKAHDMAILAWSPLAGGLLTGKFTAPDGSVDLSDSRLKNSPWGGAFLVDERLAIARGVGELAAEMGVSSSQLALAWLLQRPAGPVIPIIGAKKPEQLRENLGCLDIQLSAEQIDRLDALNPLKLGYPHSLLQNDKYQAMIHGDLRGELLRN
ncbi:MAG: aldo/keto reductase [Chromatiales bacterium]|nr:aldo/keto reductase [Chromatiales bacterium]